MCSNTIKHLNVNYFLMKRTIFETLSMCLNTFDKKTTKTVKNQKNTKKEIQNL